MEKARDEFFNYKDLAQALRISHRSNQFEAVINKTGTNYS